MPFISQNLKLPFIAPAQAMKHVTHNEALRALDAIVQLSLVSKSHTTPPATPIEGARYFVVINATDAWENQDGKIAAYQDGAWAFYTPLLGWRAWVEDESALQIWDGTAWQSSTPEQSYQNIDRIGINTTADTTNRLAVSGAATLFNHAGNGHQLKLNKNTATDTASLLYQSNWSGRAEIGLAGDDDFHFKVSPNGSTWHNAITINKNTGDVGINTNTPATNLHVNGGSALLNSVLIGASSSVTGAEGYINFSDGILTIGTNSSAHGVNIKAGTAGIKLSGFGASSNLILKMDTSTNRQNSINFMTDGIAKWYVGRTDSDIGVAEAFFIGDHSGGGNAPGGAGHKFIITSSGNIGMGVLTPATKLDVDGPVRPKSYTVNALPSAATNGAGAMVFVSNESSGAVMAFSDGTNWRRVTDRAIVT